MPYTHTDFLYNLPSLPSHSSLPLFPPTLPSHLHSPTMLPSLPSHTPLPHTYHQTLFNPNKTVVKIFVVTFDFSDMPPNSQTFLRQKTLSRPCHIPSDGRGIPAIHYLIHLR